MTNGFMIRKATVEKALNLKPNVTVTGWRTAHPSDTDFKGEPIEVKGGALTVNDPLFHESKHRDHATMKIMADLSNGGEIPVIIKKFKESSEPADRIKYIERNLRKFKSAGVTPVTMTSENNLLVHRFQEGKKLSDDDILEVLVKLEEQGISPDEKAVQHGHWRRNEHGIIFIPA